MSKPLGPDHFQRKSEDRVEILVNHLSNKLYTATPVKGKCVVTALYENIGVHYIVKDIFLNAGWDQVWVELPSNSETKLVEWHFYSASLR